MAKLPPDTPRTTSQIVASEIRHWRTRRAFSAAQLAERVNALGVDMNRAIVANIEHNRRERITVEEVYAFAYALGVPPVALLLPFASPERVAVTPEVTANSWEVFEWLTGVEPLDDTGTGVWKESTEALRFYRALREAEQGVLRSLGIWVRLSELGRADLSERGSDKQYLEQLEDVASAVRQLQGIGLDGEALLDAVVTDELERFEVIIDGPRDDLRRRLQESD